MTTITVKVSSAGFEGESAIAGHEDRMEAVSIRDAVIGSSSVSRALVSEISLTRHKDRASPKLAEACATGTNIGQVEIAVFRNTQTGMQVFMTYTLTETYVSRIEHDTAEGKGVAYGPHIGYSQGGAPTWRPVMLGIGQTVNDHRAYARFRARPNPLFPESPGGYSNNEVERIWLNAASVAWTYTPFLAGVAQGAIRQGWNLQTGQPL